MNKNNALKSKLIFLFALIFIYVLLFEFILPINKFLPKPSLLAETFVSLWPVYDLFRAFAITTTVVYLSLAVGYFVLFLKSKYVIMFAHELPASAETLKVFKYFPPFFIAMMFAFWFGDSFYAELLFGILVVTFLTLNKLFKEATKVKSEYLLVAKNLGLAKNKIYSKIIWKAVEPEVFKELFNIHYFLWIIIMIYEFVSNISGFGGIYRTALLYNDYSALIVVAVIISIIIFTGNQLLTLIQNKIFFWKQ